MNIEETKAAIEANHREMLAGIHCPNCKRGFHEPDTCEENEKHCWDLLGLATDHSRLEAEHRDLAMLVRRLIFSKSDKVRVQAQGYLKRKGLEGSILRDTAALAENGGGEDEH
jgi:hypothetical protein